MKITKVIEERPTDPTHPGFRVPGLKFRWLGALHSEANPGRIWQVLYLSDLPSEFVKKMERTNPEMYKGGDTIRRGDLTLAYAPEEKVEEHRALLDERAREQKRPSVPMGLQVEKGSGSKQYKEGPDQFR